MEDEQITFDGIPIPLTMETIVSALNLARDDYWNAKVYRDEFDHKRVRQVDAFRERILRVDAEKDADILDLNTALDMMIADLEVDEVEIEKKDATLDNLLGELAAKDARIAELEAGDG